MECLEEYMKEEDDISEVFLPDPNVSENKNLSTT